MDGDSIYYLLDSLDEYQRDIYRTDLDGKNITQLHILPQDDSGPYWMDVKDGWIYYYLCYDGSDLHRVRTDGTGDEVIFEGLVMDLELSGDWMFCFDEDTGYWYKMKPDGTDREQLYPDSMIVTGPGIPEG
jgi:Tol biopolymer transport system component